MNRQQGRALPARPSVFVFFCGPRTFCLPDPYYLLGSDWEVLTLLHTDTVPWWKWFLLSLGVITLSVVVMLIGLVALIFHGVDLQDYLHVTRPAWIRSGWVGFWIAFVIMAQNLAPVVGVALFRPARRVAFDRLRWPVSGRAALVRVLGGACLAFLVQWVWMQVGPAPGESLLSGFVYAVAHGRSFWPWVWLLLTAVVAGPVAEEILFRGMMQQFISRRWGARVGMLGSAAAFGLAHGLAGALPAALLGLYFSYQVERDGSLAGAMLLHALHNLAAVLIMALAG